MKAFTLATVLALLCPFASFAEDGRSNVDPFGAEPESPRPERSIERLPKSISYRKSKDDEHVYVVSGIYANTPKFDLWDPENPGDLAGNLMGFRKAHLCKR